MDQATIKEYRQRFDDLLTTKYFVLDTEPKYWFKQKFKWRLTFAPEQGRRYGAWDFYRELKIGIKEVDPNCRTRAEFGLSVFTNSTALLDLVLNDEYYRKLLIGVTHVDDKYEDAMLNLEGVAVDVKFINPKRYNPDHKYLLEFHWDFGYRGGVGVADYGIKGRNAKKKELYDYCLTNSDTIEIHKGLGTASIYYSNIQLYVKDESQVPLLYVMFGDIYKVWKLMKKEVKVK